MSSRKRLLDSQSRGNSPPDKRSRPSSDVASTSTKYKESGPRPALLERKDSTSVSPKGNATSSSSGDARRDLRIDTSNLYEDSNARRKSQDSSRPLENVSGSRRSSTVLDPRQAPSPASIRSGSSTPVQAAPQAPSMVPSRSLAKTMASAAMSQDQSPRASHKDLDPVERMKEIRRIRNKKQVLNPAQIGHQQGNSSVDSEVALRSRLEQQILEITELKRDRDETSARLKAIEAYMADKKASVESDQKISALSARLAKVEVIAEASRPPNDDLLKLRSDVNQLLSWKASRTNIDGELCATRNHVRNEVKAIQTRLETRMNTEHETIKCLSSMANALDAFRQDIIKQDLNARVEHLSSRLEKSTGNNGQMESLEYRVEKFAKKDLPKQIDELSDRVKSVAANENKTWDRLVQLEEDFDNLNKRVRTLTDDDRKLEEKLITEGKQCVEANVPDKTTESVQYSNLQKELKEVSEDQTKLKQKHIDAAAKVRAVEQKTTKLDLSLTKLTESVGQGNGMLQQKINQQDERLEKFRGELSTLHSRFSACATTSSLIVLETRLDTLEQRSGTLRSVEQHVDALVKDHSEFKQRLSVMQDTLATPQIVGIPPPLPSDALPMRLESNRITDAIPATSTDVIHSSELKNDLADLRREVEQQKAESEELNEYLESTEKEVHELKGLKLLQEVIPKICKEDFEKVFHPFREQVNSAFSEHLKILSDLKGGIDRTTLQQELAAQGRFIADLALRVEQPAGLQSQELFSLRVDLQGETTALSQQTAALQHETATQRQKLEDITRQMESKADHINVVQNLNRYTHSFKALQDRYDNIYTDELHMKMVHWFMQQFPNNTAALMDKVNTMSNDLVKLKQISQQLTQLDVRKLVSCTPHLDSFADARVQLQHLPQDRAATQEALRIANDALQATAQLAMSVEQLQADSMAQDTELSTTNTKITDIRSTAESASTTIAAVKHSYIEPNKEFFSMLLPTIIAVGQLQTMMRDVGKLVQDQSNGCDKTEPFGSFHFDIEQMLQHRTHEANGEGARDEQNQ